MKKIIFIAIILSGLFSCKKDFDTINKSPDLVKTPTLDYLLPTIELRLIDQRYYTNEYVLGAFMQHNVTVGLALSALDAPNNSNQTWSFEEMNSFTIKNLSSFIEEAKHSGKVNYEMMGRLMKIYVLHRLTDTYGDIPYFQAGKGSTEGIRFPEYDPQETIYMDMLNQLDTIQSSFVASAAKPDQADIMYKGDLEKWKRFANTLMLRIAMRMSEVKPAESATWVKKAIENGVFLSSDDNAVVSYRLGGLYQLITNGQAIAFLYYPTEKAGEALINRLKSDGDPRLKVFASLPNGDTTAAHQKGVPPFAAASRLESPMEDYSVANPATYGRDDAPFIHISYAQVCFIKAEAALRGWISGDPFQYYKDGVKASLEQLKVYGSSGTLDAAEVGSFTESLEPFAGNDDAMEKIATQYWLETHFNFYESFANWRRTGFPVLQQTNYTIPRRLTYSVSEYSSNEENVMKANDRQGPDLISTKVWWDVK